jgi:hypothetical protein
MLKFDIETSSSAVTITKPVNQPVCRFKISRVGWFSSESLYTGIDNDVAFTVGWVKHSKSWFWSSSAVGVKGNVPEITLRAEYRFRKMALCDYARGIEIAWHSPNQYVVRDADHEVARIYIYKASFGFTNSDTYVLTVLDEEIDLTLLFLYVFCFRFVMAGEGGGKYGVDAGDGGGDAGHDIHCYGNDGDDGDCDGGDCDGGGGCD